MMLQMETEHCYPLPCQSISLIARNSMANQRYISLKSAGLNQTGNYEK